MTFFHFIFPISIIYLLPFDAHGISCFSNKLQYNLLTWEIVFWQQILKMVLYIIYIKTSVTSKWFGNMWYCNKSKHWSNTKKTNSEKLTIHKRVASYITWLQEEWIPSSNFTLNDINDPICIIYVFMITTFASENHNPKRYVWLNEADN